MGSLPSLLPRTHHLSLSDSLRAVGPSFGTKSQQHEAEASPHPRLFINIYFPPGVGMHVREKAGAKGM